MPARLLMAPVLLLALTSVVEAGVITFSGSLGDLNASVRFEQSGNQLKVTLTNTSMSDVLVPADVLTAVFFEISGHPTLSKLSAVLGSGSSVFFGGTDAGGVVGGEWAYVDSLSTSSNGATGYGISSTGLNLFGPGDRFPGNNLSGPASVNGLQYGITSAGDNPHTGNSAVSDANPNATPYALIHNSVDFTFDGLDDDFNLDQIHDVRFQYGTSLQEPSFSGTQLCPEPSTYALFCLGGAGMLLLARKRGA